jgi:hypothetical protein
VKFKNILVIATFMIAFSLVAAGPVSAGKPAGKGGGKPNRTSVTLVASPSTVEIGGYVVVDGAGLQANSIYYVGINSTLEWYQVPTNAEGKFSYAFPQQFNWPGTYSICVAAGATPLACTPVTVQ